MSTVERDLIAKLLKHLRTADSVESQLNDLLGEDGCVAPEIQLQRRDVMAEAEAYLGQPEAPG